MLRITLFALLFSSQLGFAQANASVFFEDFIPANQFGTLNPEQLTKLCKKHRNAFDQILTTNGSKNKNDWSLVNEYLIKYPDVAEPIGYLVDFNTDSILDLVIAFQAGQEYAYVGLYDGKDDVYTCVFQGRGEFFGQSSKGWVYVNKACCEDPTHEFFVIAADEHGHFNPVDSFSVASAYENLFPTHDQFLVSSEYYKNTKALWAVTNGIERYVSIQEGAMLRVIKNMEVDGNKLFFVELLWSGNAVLYPKSYCWVLAD